MSDPEWARDSRVCDEHVEGFIGIHVEQVLSDTFGLFDDRQS
jgi:hypothetical protein